MFANGAMVGRGRVARKRAGAALVELALILPLLCFMFVASTDFARAFHDYVIVTDRARSASLYASQNVGTPGVPATNSAAWTSGITAAALADTPELASVTQVSVSPSTLPANPTGNNTVSITVSSPFKTILTYPGIPHQFTLSRTFQVRIQPTVYRMN